MFRYSSANISWESLGQTKPQPSDLPLPRRSFYQRAVNWATPLVTAVHDRPLARGRSTNHRATMPTSPRVLSHARSHADISELSLGPSALSNSQRTVKWATPLVAAVHDRPLTRQLSTYLGPSSPSTPKIESQTLSAEDVTELSLESWRTNNAESESQAFSDSDEDEYDGDRIPMAIAMEDKLVWWKAYDRFDEISALVNPRQ